MTIYGISQTSGAERQLKVEMGAQGVVLTVIDHKSKKELSRILVETDDLLTAITTPAEGGTNVNGIVPPFGPKMVLNVDVRRNEVWLTASGEGGTGDAAVGADDFQDALEGVINRS